MKLWNSTLCIAGILTTQEIQATKTSLGKCTCLSRSAKKVLFTSAAPNWCNVRNIVAPAGSLLAWLLSLAELSVKEKTDYVPLLLRITRDTSIWPLLFKLLWWLDNTWSGGCMYFVSVPGRDKRQMMDGGWDKVRGGERHGREKHSDKSDDSQSLA